MRLSATKDVDKSSRVHELMRLCAKAAVAAAEICTHQPKVQRAARKQHGVRSMDALRKCRGARWDVTDFLNRTKH